MKIIHKLAGAVIATVLLSASHICSAQTTSATSGSMALGQTSVAYADGPVWLITLVKTKSGMTEDYLKGLEKAIMGVIDEAKKQNMVSDFKILIGDAATTQDFNIMVMVQSKEWPISIKRASDSIAFRMTSRASRSAKSWAIRCYAT